MCIVLYKVSMVGKAGNGAKSTGRYSLLRQLNLCLQGYGHNHVVVHTEKTLLFSNSMFEIIWVIGCFWTDIVAKEVF